MCRLIPKINRRVICDCSLRDMSVCSAAFTTLFSVIVMGLFYHGMKNPQATQISNYENYHTTVCIIVFCVFAVLFISSIIFAVGIQEQWPLLYLPWIVTYSIATILVVAQLIFLMINNFHLPHVLLGFLAAENVFSIWIGCNFYEETTAKVRAETRRKREQRHNGRDSQLRYSDFS